MHERERWHLILNRLRERGIVRIGDLAALTGASVATLRRDLAKLEDSGQLRRVHGGAEGAGVSGQNELTATSFGASQTQHATEKRAVAALAAGLCEDGDSIILNAGSTTWFLAQCLRGHRMQVLTNSFPIAQELIAHSANRVVLPGGELYREPGIILSPFDEDAIQHFAASKMFMSCYAITPLGVIESDPLIARAEAKLLTRTERLIVVADSSKFEARGNMVVCPLSRVSTVVTDTGAPPQMVEHLRSVGVEVLIADPQERKVLTAA
ncbi:DeoR/GlpR family DNA-binding transcription regulator [Rhodobacter sp. Har01]|uniref:DeoR/GlpR family DNA-binding transcription regulator n=1 Tax=Rhodobacter sp. Har01 TaxID=2883999 RepID=UPI001D083148|nr:DeoR/GlpR family DNA-binding transcription regulator [Rhodobacter sp. Har01]MCB6180057.1 DeoR/GlpR family DNA-binding transcription regulator [Rhodobacter sp. Har01]